MAQIGSPVTEAGNRGNFVVTIPVLMHPLSETLKKVIVYTITNKERAGSCYKIWMAL